MPRLRLGRWQAPGWAAAPLLAWLCTAGVAHADDDATACLKSREAPGQLEARCTAALSASDISAPTRAQLLTRRGLIRLSEGDGARALTDFNAALDSDGASYWAYNARAVVWLQSGKADLAIADAQHAVGLKPDYAGAWNNLADAHLMHGDFDQALADVDKALQYLASRREIAYTAQGKIRLAKSDTPGAIESFNAAIAANPQYANAWSARGAARWCAGDFEAASADLRNAWQQRKNADTAVELVIALRRAGHDASAELESAKEQFPAAQGLPSGIALFGGMLKPEQVLGTAQDRDPHVAQQRQCSAHFQVAEWYLLQSNPASAREQFTLARQMCEPGEVTYAIAAAELARLK